MIALVLARETRAELPEKGVDFPCLAAAYDDADRATILRRIGEAGAEWVRMRVRWDFAVPTEGDYTVPYGTLLDYCLEQADSNDLGVILLVDHTPKWAQAYPAKGRWSPPADCVRAGDACVSFPGFLEHLLRAHVLAHVPPSRVALEIWGEPNTYQWAGSEDEYVQLLRVVYGRVKDVSDSVRLLMGGPTRLAHRGEGCRSSWTAWVACLWADGASRYTDAVALHPYPSYDRSPCESVSSVFQDVRGPIRRTVGTKEIWLTEMGWSSGSRNRDGAWVPGGGWASRGSPPRRLCSTRRQAARLRSAFGYDHLPGTVKTMVWFVADRVVLDATYGGGCRAATDDWDCGTELLDRSLRPRPVYAVFEDAP